MNEHSRRVFPARWAGIAATLAISACALVPIGRFVAGLVLVLCVPGASLAAAAGPPARRLRSSIWAASAVVVAVSATVDAIVALVVSAVARFHPAQILVVIGVVSVVAQLVGLATDRHPTPERRDRNKELQRPGRVPLAIGFVLLSSAVAVSLVSAGGLRQREGVVEVAAKRSGHEIVVAVGSTSCVGGQTQRLTVAVGTQISSWRVHASCDHWARVVIGPVRPGAQVRAVAEQRARTPATVVLTG